MNIKCVIFDVDGVLVDSVHYHYTAWKMLFDEENIPFSYQDYLTKVNGLPRLAGIKNIAPNLSDERLVALAERKQGFYIQALEKEAPKPLVGVVDLLKSLKDLGIKRAAASSSKNAVRVLELAHLDSYFSTIVSGHDFTKSKPDPEIFLVASKRMGVEPKTCAVIEDAAAGIQAAKMGNMTAIGVLSSSDEKIKDLADFSVSSLKEYPSILRFIQEKKFH